MSAAADERALPGASEHDAPQLPVRLECPDRRGQFEDLVGAQDIEAVLVVHGDPGQVTAVAERFDLGVDSRVVV